MNMQAAFTDLLRAAVEARGFDFTVDLAYANAGTFRARRAGTLVELVAVNFDFQKCGSPNYASFTIHSDKPGPQPEQLHSVKFPELQGALDKILSHLPTSKILLPCLPTHEECVRTYGSLLKHNPRARVYGVFDTKKRMRTWSTSKENAAEWARQKLWESFTVRKLTARDANLDRGAVMKYELQHVTRGGESFFAVIAAGCIAAELRNCANESQAGEAFRSYKARAAALARITINGHAFARNDRHFDAECRGFFQSLRGGLLLLDKDKLPVACLVMNRHGERFFVAAARCTEGAGTYYMHSTDARADEFLGLTGLSYLRRNAIAEQAAREFLRAPIRLTAQRETHSRRANG